MFFIFITQFYTPKFTPKNFCYPPRYPQKRRKIVIKQSENYRLLPLFIPRLWGWFLETPKGVKTLLAWGCFPNAKWTQKKGISHSLTPITLVIEHPKR